MSTLPHLILHEESGEEPLGFVVEIWKQATQAVALIATVLVSSTVAAQNRTVTFDWIPRIQSDQQIGGYSIYLEVGMQFTALGRTVYDANLTRNGGGIQRFAFNGTAYLNQTPGSTVVVGLPKWSVYGTTFGVVSVDLAEYSTLFQMPREAVFVGYRPDGGVVTNVFWTDGIIDSLGPENDFQRLYFGEGFDNITRLEILKFDALDNLVVKPAVPEPATWMLLVLGGVIVLVNHKRPGKPRCGVTNATEDG